MKINSQPEKPSHIIHVFTSFTRHRPDYDFPTFTNSLLARFCSQLNQYVLYFKIIKLANYNFSQRAKRQRMRISFHIARCFCLGPVHICTLITHSFLVIAAFFSTISNVEFNCLKMLFVDFTSFAVVQCRVFRYGMKN